MTKENKTLIAAAGVASVIIVAVTSVSPSGCNAPVEVQLSVLDQIADGARNALVTHDRIKNTLQDAEEEEGTIGTLVAPGKLEDATDLPKP